MSNDPAYFSGKLEPTLVELLVVVALVGTGRVDTVLIADDLPEL